MNVKNARSVVNEFVHFLGIEKVKMTAGEKTIDEAGMRILVDRFFSYVLSGEKTVYLCRIRKPYYHIFVRDAGYGYRSFCCRHVLSVERKMEEEIELVSLFQEITKRQWCSHCKISLLRIVRCSREWNS